VAKGAFKFSLHATRVKRIYSSIEVDSIGLTPTLRDEKWFTTLHVTSPADKNDSVTSRSQCDISGAGRP
jgi:hypothetical protein